MTGTGQNVHSRGDPLWSPSKMRLRRSELSTPASNERMIEKAAASSADLVFLDMEDSVAPNEKVGARAKVIHALKTLDWGKKTRAVRVNDLETEYAYQDIITIVEEAGEYFNIIIVPKVKSARDVWWVDVLLTQIEKRLKRTRRIGIEVLIEEVEAMINVEEIARSSSRLEALILARLTIAHRKVWTTGLLKGILMPILATPGTTRETRSPSPPVPRASMP